MAVYHGVAVISQTTEAGVTSVKDGLGTAASAASGYPVTDLETVRQDTGWRPADSDPANSRLLVQLDSQESVGAVVATGLEEMTGPDDAYRVRWAKDFMAKPCLPLVSGTSPAAGITETASWTVSALVRFEGMSFLASADDVFELRNHATTSDNTTRLVQVAIGAAGHLLTRIERMGGSANEQDWTAGAQVDDGSFHWLDISFADASPSASTATVYLDGTSLGPLSVTPVFGTNTLRLSVSGNHHIAGIWLWDSALSAAELTAFRHTLRDGNEDELAHGWNVSETSGTTVADIKGGETLTIGAGTYSTATNPGAAYSPAAKPRHQAWSRRASLDTGNVSTTSSDRTVSPLFHVFGWIRTLRGKPATEPTQAYLGTASSDGNNDWRIALRPTGTFRVYIDRFGAGTKNVTSTTDISDAALYRFSFWVTWGATGSLAINGIEEDTVTGLNAYSASAVSEFSILGSSQVEFGPIVISRRVRTHAEADAILLGTAPLIPGEMSDPEDALFYPLTEATGTTAANRGSASGGDMTVVAADWQPNALSNPSPGSQVGNMADRPWQAAWEIAEGANHDADEILLEIFAPDAATLTVYSLYILRVVWPEIGVTGGQDSGTGPDVDITSVGVQRSEPGDTGRDVSYVFAKLTHAEASNIRHHCLEARRTRRAGATSPMRPIAIIYRAEDASEWAERCAVLIPDLPRKQLDTSQKSWEWALTVGGREIRYGSNF